MLESNVFAVKEHVKFLKTHRSYDIFDGETEEKLGTAVEQIGSLNKMLRWFISQQLMPTTIEIREDADDALLFTISRGAFLFRSRVEVRDSQGELIGYFKSKVFTIGGGFHVYDRNDKHFAELKGNFIGFNYRLLSPDHEIELGKVTKKWGGLTKELFTSADTYRVEVDENLSENPISKMLVLAAALATDMIFKSESRTLDV